MKTQSDSIQVSIPKLVARIRALGSLRVSNGLSFETDLAQQLDMPEYSPAELAEAVEQLVFTGELRRFVRSVDLGKGGVTNESITEEVAIFTLA